METATAPQAEILFSEALATLDALLAERGLDPDAPIIGRAAAVLDGLAQAAILDPQILAASPERFAHLTTGMCALAPLLREALLPTAFAERTHFALGCARRLFMGDGDGLWFDRLAHTSLFRSELQAFKLRAEINRRGDPLMRLVAINQALSASRDAGLPLQ